jgi:membrane fusion protein, multidrug efflux system
MKNVLALVMIALLAISCGKQEDKQKQLEELTKQYAQIGAQIDSLKKELAAKDTTVKGAPIRIETITHSVFKRPVDIQGVVESDKNVVVSSEVAGRIVDVFVKEGQNVSEGQLLARVNGDITANSIAEVENGLKLAETTYKKQKALREQNVGTEMQLLQAENQRDALKKQLETLRSQYAKYSITSPVTGTIDDVNVNPGENTMPGMPIARVVNNSILTVKAEVSEKYVKVVHVGDSVLLKFPGLGEEMGAKVSAVGQIINPANRTFSVVVNITKGGQMLKPNLLAMVTIYDYVNPNAITVPSNIILSTGTESYVYVLETKGKTSVATRRVIKTGNVAGAFTEVISGLSEGDAIIVENYNSLSEGAEVMVIK